jgi:hypothetical protein
MVNLFLLAEEISMCNVLKWHARLKAAVDSTQIHYEARNVGI